MNTVVIGGGIMGAGIAYESLVAGHTVTIVESREEFVASARERVEHYEHRARSKGNELEGFGTLTVTTDLEGAVAAADIVVEAVPEDLDLKQAVWSRIGAAASDTAVLGAAGGRPTQTVGTHFFNPVPAMRLVEVIRGADTDPAILERALAFCAALGKETVEVADLPGFVTTRLGCILMCEAMRVYQEGVASAEHIDTGMKLGYNHPMGPLELADRIGLDTILLILEDLREAYGDAFRPPPVLRQMVAAGRLGRKSGRGFYDHA